MSGSKCARARPLWPCTPRRVARCVLAGRELPISWLGCLNGLITPILLTYVLILANRASVLGSAANGRAFKIVATISIVAVLSATVLVQSILSGLGIT